jgi:hypothetical protein
MVTPHLIHKSSLSTKPGGSQADQEGVATFDGYMYISIYTMLDKLELPAQTAHSLAPSATVAV